MGRFRTSTETGTTPEIPSRQLGPQLGGRRHYPPIPVRTEYVLVLAVCFSPLHLAQAPEKPALETGKESPQDEAGVGCRNPQEHSQLVS